MNPNVDLLFARAQVLLAFFYGVIFLGMFVFMAVFWNALTKFDVGLLTMFATGAMSQSKDAGSYFFARQRPHTVPDPATTDTSSTSTVTITPKAPVPEVTP